MALFYQINFTSEQHARRRIGLWVALFLIVCLLVGTGCFCWYLYEESRQPVLAPRLNTYQTHLAQVTQTLKEWKEAEAGWLEVRAYVEQEGQLAPQEMLRAFEGLARLGERPSADARCPYALLPERMEISREGRVVVTGEARLPESEKLAHCQRLAELVTACVTSSVDCVSNTVTGHVFPLAPQTFAFAWAKAVPGAEDDRMKATLTATFASAKPLTFLSPPVELERQLAETKAWRAKVAQCVLEVTPGKKEKVETLLNLLLSECKQGLGERYESLKGLAETAVNPLAVTRAFREALAEKGAKEPARLAAFDRAWAELAQENWPWRRVKELDSPALDAAIANLGAWLEGGVLPRKQVFEVIQSRNRAYLQAMTNGVQRKHIEQERTFWREVLLPSLTVRHDLVPSEALKAALDGKDQASRVAFPLWRVSLGEDKDAQAKTGGVLTLDELRRVLTNVETNAAGLWVTAATVEFDKAPGDPLLRWSRLTNVSIEGRVPCWVGAGAPLKP